MKKIGFTARAWLKGFHILFACLWVGAVVCVMLLTYIRGHITSGDELWTVHASIKLINDYIVIPAAMGCLITGVLFSWLTNWGFFKYKWVIVKYIINIGVILFGVFFLGPWIDGMESIANMEGLAALQNATYIHYAKMNISYGGIPTISLIVAVLISTLKPWSKKDKTALKKQSVENI